MDYCQVLHPSSPQVICFFPWFSAGACEEIFKIASMAPGALLLEAHKEYEVRHIYCVGYTLLKFDMVWQNMKM